MFSLLPSLINTVFPMMASVGRCFCYSLSQLIFGDFFLHSYCLHVWLSGDIVRRNKQVVNTGLLAKKKLKIPVKDWNAGAAWWLVSSDYQTFAFRFQFHHKCCSVVRYKQARRAGPCSAKTRTVWSTDSSPTTRYQRKVRNKAQLDRFSYLI